MGTLQVEENHRRVWSWRLKATANALGSAGDSVI